MRVTTIYGEMDEKDLVKFEYPDTSGAEVSEYYWNKTLVHRSVTVQLRGVAASAAMQSFG